jgi:hypothetical protein
MNIPAWQVRTWDTVLLTPRTLRTSLPRMRHLGTTVLPASSESLGLRHGQVIWGAQFGPRQVGLAWDWSEVADGVVAMSDPMTIVSNIGLLNGQGELLEESARIVCLNDVVHQLDWQREFCASNEVEILKRA